MDEWGPLSFHLTDRHFSRADFGDLYGSECSIQESSLYGQYAIWLGADKRGFGDRIESQRMHLSRKMAFSLILALIEFVIYGSVGRCLILCRRHKPRSWSMLLTLLWAAWTLWAVGDGDPLAGPGGG